MVQESLQPSEAELSMKGEQRPGRAQQAGHLQVQHVHCHDTKRSHAACVSVDVYVCLTGIPPRCCLSFNAWNWGQRQCTVGKAESSQMC